MPPRDIKAETCSLPIPIVLPYLALHLTNLQIRTKPVLAKTQALTDSCSNPFRKSVFIGSMHVNRSSISAMLMPDFLRGIYIVVSITINTGEHVFTVSVSLLFIKYIGQ